MSELTVDGGASAWKCYRKCLIGIKNSRYLGDKKEKA